MQRWLSILFLGDKMHKISALTLALISSAFAAGTAGAQQISVVQYTCNIEGAPAQLTAQVQAVNSTGNPGDVNYFYQGSLVSQSSRYTFTGTNQYADFVDLLSNERFRAQFILQGPQLLIIVNPQGPGPVQYLCQLSGQR